MIPDNNGRHRGSLLLRVSVRAFTKMKIVNDAALSMKLRSKALDGAVRTLLRNQISKSPTDSKLEVRGGENP